VKIKIYIFSLVMILGLGGQSSFAETLSNVAVFYRCYAHLTQRRPAYNDPLTIAVRSGARDPISACLEVLDHARFTQAGQTQIDPNDPLAITVLQTIHKLHSSWFLNKDIVDIDNENPSRDIFDTSAPALYFTRALFGGSVPVDTVLTDTQTIRAIRTGENLTSDPLTRGPSSNYVYTSSIFSGNAGFKFAGKGDLLGYEVLGLQTSSYSYSLNTQTVSGSVDLGRHYGGGLLGHPVYLLANVQQLDDFRSDGAILTPRKFARAIFSDLFCRSIPVVRDSDIGEFVVTTSTIPFRNAASCVRCHATIDRMAFSIRNFQYNSPGFNELMLLGVNMPQMYTPNLSPEVGWPSVADRDFYRRPPNGVLFYRNYNGDLINLPVNGLHDLGLKLAQQEDMHICTAKRYYRYFTGIDVFVGDMGDTSTGVTLTEAELSHRNQVISLGRNLKSHQSLRQLIQDILSLPIYKESNFGVTGQ